MKSEVGTGREVNRIVKFLRSQAWLPGLLLIGATLIAYQPVWHAGFIWDDDGRLINNPLTGAADD